LDRLAAELGGRLERGEPGIRRSGRRHPHGGADLSAVSVGAAHGTGMW
jgi:hypothetical protein